MLRLTGPLTQPLGASSEALGAVVSMRTVADLWVSALPTASTDQYSIVLTPWADTENGAE